MQMALIALFELMFNNGFNPFINLVKDGMNPGTMLCLAILGGLVTGVGPRYCPSIEDKLVRFSDKERHQLFIEPEGEYIDVEKP